MTNTQALLFSVLLAFSQFCFAAEVSITIDDPESVETPLMSAVERNKKILDSLDQYKIKAALFVCGTRIDNEAGRDLLSTWDEKGHMLANHTYSHYYFHSTKVTLKDFIEDFEKAEPLLQPYKNFRKFFRYPYLKEGNSPEKRDGMRKELKRRGYSQGYVTIDASDWYIDLRLRDKLRVNPKADLTPYRDYYLKHIWQRAEFYNGLAKKVFGREIKHTLLIHHNLLNALFLKDVLQMFRDKKWVLISAQKAFEDPAFKSVPQTMPAGESLVWAMAKESGKFDSLLRYPGEDCIYEKDEMDRLGL